MLAYFLAFEAAAKSKSYLAVSHCFFPTALLLNFAVFTNIGSHGLKRTMDRIALASVYKQFSGCKQKRARTHSHASGPYIPEAEVYLPLLPCCTHLLQASITSSSPCFFTNASNSKNFSAFITRGVFT